LVATFILIFTVYEKFEHGAWLTVLITGSIMIVCLFIRQHYRNTAAQLAAQNQQLVLPDDIAATKNPATIDHQAPTAVFLVSQHLWLGMQLVMVVLRLFPNRFKNFVFMRVGEVDSDNFGGAQKLEELKRDVNGDLSIYKNYLQNMGYAVDARHAYGPDKLSELMKLADEVHAEYKDVIFFSAKLIFENENFFTRMLHNNTAYAMQRLLHLKHISLMVLPIKV
jgi:hypothetical protein